MALISVIIPVYNKAPFLRRCFDSLIYQTDKSAQIIIVDDGSTDGGGKICDEYAKRYKWEVYHTKNAGVSAARNLGISKANGDYIVFLDADDALAPEAIDVMTRMARHDFNIVQFGQYRYSRGLQSPVFRRQSKGHCTFETLPRHWMMVWNKMYKRAFIYKHRIRFKEGLQFGEDELFSIKSLIANDGMYIAPQTLMRHYFDDTNSLCRGGLSLERLKGLDDGIVDIIKQLKKHKTTKNQRAIEWLECVRDRHHNSEVFRRFGWKREPKGKYDVVYLLKETAFNAELLYSLRSLEMNWQFNKVWFYGGCSERIKPDHHVPVEQNQPSKWENVRSMLVEVCKNDDITEDFWLFNDDFFVLKPVSENMPPQYNGSLKAQIERVERKHNGSTDYTMRLRHLLETLEKAKKPTLNYSVHKPMLINRKKALEVLTKFPDEPMFRALYGNYWRIGGNSCRDMKVMLVDYDMKKIKDWPFVSTEDVSWRIGTIGKFLRNKFNQKGRFEI